MNMSQFITLYIASLLCTVVLFLALRMTAKFKDELKARLIFLRVFFGYNFLAMITLSGNWLWLKTGAFVLWMAVLLGTSLYEWRKTGVVR